MSVTVKVFYERSNGQKEIRRFAVNSGNGSDIFTAIREKVMELYSPLSQGNFQMFWQDPDGDRIAFSTKEELQEALGFVTDGVLRVYIPEMKEDPQPSTGTEKEPPRKPQQPTEEDQNQQRPQQDSEKQSGNANSNNGPFHPGVTCDGCEGPIYGLRFKCCVCPDYDLCSGCEGKGMHNEHDMYKIGQPRANPFAFLPPHLGRHIHRYMRMGANGPSASATASASSGSSAHSSASDEYLNKMGASIAAFLDPFGIDVTYDVHDNGDHQNGGWRRGCGFRRGGGCGFGGAGPQGPCPAWEEMEKRYATEKKKEKQEKETNKDMETDDVKSPKPHVSEDVPMKEESRKESPGHKSNGSEEWTFVSDQEAQMASANPQTPIPMPAPATQTAPTRPPPPAQAPAPRADSSSNMYPNLRIQQSLDQMLAMGFSNTDNWLSDLLTENDGDIGNTLDAIKAKATQQLDSLRGSQ